MIKNKTIFVYVLVLTIFLIGSNQVFATKKSKDFKAVRPVKKIELEKKEVFNSQKDLYGYAQKDLDKYTYRVYRIAERIIRANKLDNYPWVFEMNYAGDYKVNAASSNSNLITLDSGSIFTFADDLPMLAAVIAHEMSHLTIQHQSKALKQATVLQDQLKESSSNLKKRAQNYGKNLKEAKALNVSFSNRNEILVIDRESEKIEKQTEEIKNDMLAFSRMQEYEADKLGLRYITKAGFDPYGMIRTMEFSKRSPETAQDDSTHPEIKNRIWQIDKEIKSMDWNKLKTEGKLNLTNSKPLTYELTNDFKYTHLTKRKLIIHSKAGTNQNSNKPFEQMFGY